MEQKQKISFGSDFLVGTPGRLVDFLERGFIRTEELAVLCLD